MKSGELFAGVGGLGRAVDEVFRTTPAWFAEIDAAPSRVLAHHYPDVPNLGDVSAIDWSDPALHVDVLAGGFPCQDVSLAGRRRGLKEGTRSGLWSEFARAIDHIRPDWAVIENVRGLLSADATGDVEPCPWCLGDAGGQHALRALGAVLGDLAELGFDAEWVSLRAADIGAPHGRFRVFILAWPATNANGDGLGGVRRVESVGRDLDGRRGSDGSGAAGEPATHLTLLPTPQVADGDGGHARRSGSRSDELPLPGAAVEHATTWGPYEPAIRRWEQVIGRPAPAPVRMDGKGGKARLNPELPEWMMGWPEGWVTAPAIGLSRAEQLKACGNGVVTLQAVAALKYLRSRASLYIRSRAA